MIISVAINLAIFTGQYFDVAWSSWRDCVIASPESFRIDSVGSQNNSACTSIVCQFVRVWLGVGVVVWYGKYEKVKTCCFDVILIARKSACKQAVQPQRMVAVLKFQTYYTTCTYLMKTKAATAQLICILILHSYFSWFELFSWKQRWRKLGPVSMK